MTVITGRWIALIAWLALLTVGKPANGNMTDGLKKSRYLGSMSAGEVSVSSIRVTSVDKANPLRQADIQVVVSGLSGDSGHRVIASNNSASLKLLSPSYDLNCEWIETAKYSGPEQRLTAQSVAPALNHGRILLGPASETPQNVGPHQFLGSSLAAISRLVRSAYQPEIQPNNHELPDARSRVPVQSVGFTKKTRSASITPVSKKTRQLKLPSNRNIDIFIIDSNGQPSKHLNSFDSDRGLGRSDFPDDACWFLDNGGCNRCLLGTSGNLNCSPVPADAATSNELAPSQKIGCSEDFVAKDTLAIIPDNREIDEIAVDSLPMPVQQSETRIGNRGLPAISISNLRSLKQPTLTVNTVYQSVKSIVRVVEKIAGPFLGLAETWRLQQKLDTVYSVFKSTMWPSHLGRYMNVIGHYM